MLTSREQALEQAEMFFEWSLSLIYSVTEGNKEMEKNAIFLERKGEQIIEQFKDYYSQSTEKSQELRLENDKLEKLMDLREI